MIAVLDDCSTCMGLTKRGSKKVPSIDSDSQGLRVVAMSQSLFSRIITAKLELYSLSGGTAIDSKIRIEFNYSDIVHLKVRIVCVRQFLKLRDSVFPVCGIVSICICTSNSGNT